MLKVISTCSCFLKTDSEAKVYFLHSSLQMALLFYSFTTFAAIWKFAPRLSIPIEGSTTLFYFIVRVIIGSNLHWLAYLVHQQHCSPNEHSSKHYWTEKNFMFNWFRIYTTINCVLLSLVIFIDMHWLEIFFKIPFH